MKKFGIAVVFVVLAGGAYAADFAGLPTVKVSDIKEAAAGNAALVKVGEAVAVKEAVKYGGLDVELRIKDCYSGPHSAMEALGASPFLNVLSMETGRAFLKCQVEKEPRLMLRSPLQSPVVIGEAIEALGYALAKDLSAFAMTFDRLFKLKK